MGTGDMDRGNATGLLSIGAFSRASKLTAKALRLYDELGLLRPARVDPWSGYRYYEPAQLERARLVAWLRMLGMPLARIQAVCEMSPAAAARDVAGYWERVESDTASRRDLAAFLVGYLSSKEDAMAAPEPLGIRYAARSDIGRQRATNQDSAYAGARLLAVADGFGSLGEQASAAVIEALKPLETSLPAGDLLNALRHAVDEAGSAIGQLSGAGARVPRSETDAPGGTGTTVTAVLFAGSQLALVHIGDTRAYLLRDGEMFQVTHDHTLVQSWVDEGRITADEAASHPQRSLLLRAIDGGGARADVSLHDVRAGDRYLLCSDGLTAMVDSAAIQAVLAAEADPDEATQRLVDLANQAGGPDNIVCAVADVVSLPAPGGPSTGPGTR